MPVNFSSSSSAHCRLAVRLDASKYRFSDRIFANRLTSAISPWVGTKCLHVEVVVERLVFEMTIVTLMGTLNLAHSPEHKMPSPGKKRRFLRRVANRHRMARPSRNYWPTSSHVPRSAKFVPELCATVHVKFYCPVTMYDLCAGYLLHISKRRTLVTLYTLAQIDGY